MAYILRLGMNATPQAAATRELTGYETAALGCACFVKAQLFYATITPLAVVA
jgi:hypothetical protein